jgi:hypothetical protein
LLQGHVEDAEAKKALCRADTLLNMKHGMVRLDNVWGVGGGIKPVKYLVRHISSCFYQCSGSVFIEMVRLDNVWGVGGGIKPVKYLVPGKFRSRIFFLLFFPQCFGSVFFF